MPLLSAFLTHPPLSVRPFPRAVGLCSHRPASVRTVHTQRPPRRTHLMNLEAESSSSALGFGLSEAPIVSFITPNGDFSHWSRPGAYAIRDRNGELVYVGYARDVGKRLSFHVTHVPQQCVSFQTYLPSVPRGEITPDLLEGVLEYWVRENGRMPRGNVEDRALWEGTAADRKRAASDNAAQHRASDAVSSSAKGEAHAADTAEAEPAVPVRERRTPKRRVSERTAFRPKATSFRNGSARRKRGTASWEPVDDDYVEVNVDPLDPFTATSHRRTTRDGVWDPSGGEDDGEDWLPIFGLVGVASLIWLFSVLGNALPTAAPSLGM